MGTENNTNKFIEKNGHHIVEVTSGTPFHISKDLLGPLQVVNENLSMIGSIELELKGLGSGILEILSDQAAFNESLRRESFGVDEKVLIKTPNGPIAIGKTYIDDEDEYNEIVEDPPVRFELHLGDYSEEESLTQEQINQIVFEISVNKTTFQGIPQIAIQDDSNWDTYESKVDDLGYNEKGTVQFKTYKDSESNNVSCPFIVNDADEIQKVEFTIYF